MGRIIILHFLLVCIPFLSSGENYDTALIPDSLLKNSNAIVRYDSISYKLIDQSKAEMSRFRVITILNKKGEDYASAFVYYDRNIKVNSFSGEIIDSTGKRIRKIKKEDITDNSLIQSFTLFQDDRYLEFTALNNTYPYTIVTEYSVTFNGLVDIDRWMPVPGYHVAVEKSVLAISSANVPLKFMPVKFGSNTKDCSLQNGKDFKWVMTTQTPFEKEDYSPPTTYNLPVLWTVPQRFEFEGHAGSYDSWQSFGAWQWELLKGKQILPPNTLDEIKKLTSQTTSTTEKIEKLYSYLQGKTRYVSIQLGIGGWEPFPSSVVDEVGYGDCKALSNYMVSLLEAVGIHSYYAIIGNGDQKIRFPQFPSMGQANHAIVCVPLENDTIWLECTNQNIPFGYIGNGNSDRYALLISPEGGKLVRTPKLTKQQNLQNRNSIVTLDPDGHAKVTIQTKFKGLQFSNRHFLLNESKEEQKKWYLRNFLFNAPILNKFELIQQEDNNPVITENLDIYIPKFANITGPRLFVRPNLMNKFASPPVKTQIRKFDIYFDFPFTDTDSIKYIIPEGFVQEAMIEDIEFESEFGRYAAKIITENNELLYIRKLEMNSGIWPPSSYENLRNFLNSVWKADQSIIVFRKT